MPACRENRVINGEAPGGGDHGGDFACGNFRESLRTSVADGVDSQE
jgi:hypothetical protein